MAKLGSIDFDERILDALRDNNLVIFAGAGVSMGPPSNLASFWRLAEQIAEGTGLEVEQPLDRFLGRLQHKQVHVHMRAADRLSPPGSAPNALHRNLLRLFGTGEKVRLVTTNFDQHFTTAYVEQFGKQPTIYSAPALPLGHSFAGIVHVHGALSRPEEMVLTDADFGRGYLTEGWARRFLVDVFRRFTVLFVGYSHDDVVMTYLARSLPVDALAGRFALTENGEKWDLLGITPVLFKKGHGELAYSDLYDGLDRLANRAVRGALDWQARLVEIAGRNPPVDDETVGEVEQALREVHLLRLFLQVCKSTDWLRWLGARKYLASLFRPGELDECGELLATWLAQNFANGHPEVVFEVFSANGQALHPSLWWSLMREIGLSKETTLELPLLRRWTGILLACAPSRLDPHAMSWLAGRCAATGDAQLALRVFISMSRHRLLLKSRFSWSQEDDGTQNNALSAEHVFDSNHWSLNEVWIKYIKPHLAQVTSQLLAEVSRQFLVIRADLLAWDAASDTWDPVSFRRSAIEPHEQDRFPEPVDVLIDAARDAIEFLATDDPDAASNWIETFLMYDVPVLRRLAIHAISIHPGMSAEMRLEWLVDRIGLYGLNEHHEVYQLVGKNYALAVDATRKKVVDAVMSHQSSALGEQSSAIRTERAHFDWLSWLSRAKADCSLARIELDKIRAVHVEWRASDHPDLTHWSGPAGWVGPQSPWSIDELLASPAADQLDALLTFEGETFLGPDRPGLIEAVREATKTNGAWGLALAAALESRSLCSSDLWPAIMRGWSEADLDVETWRELLSIVSKMKLYAFHIHDSANLLFAIVKNQGKPFATEILREADAVALETWRSLGDTDADEVIDDWLQIAINRPAGVLAEFWINALSLLLSGAVGAERVLPDSYRARFNMMIEDRTVNGGLARSVLAGQTGFLFGVDEEWVQEHLFPLFSDEDSARFRQAWDGFLVWGRMYPDLAEALLPACLTAMERLHKDLAPRRQNFIKLLATLSVFHAPDPTKDLIPTLFKYGDGSDHVAFSSYVGYLLKHLAVEAKQQLWKGWLRQYWSQRSEAVPAPLSNDERAQMLDWLLDLDEAYPAGVKLATVGPPVNLEHSSLLFQLRETDLPVRFSSETASLLVFLSSCELGYQTAYLKEIATRLVGLTDDQKRSLAEALVRAGAV
ncbi:DUF4020 domain-containing protein [Variovorax sp. 22077]|uniref:DUF4020 domain-containing protein n=1 Tax=Variovorax sp. 22077 TaxID=3453867 RepID=UPI003F83FDDF